MNRQLLLAIVEVLVMIDAMLIAVQIHKGLRYLAQKRGK